MRRSGAIRVLFSSHTSEWVGPTNSLFTLVTNLDRCRFMSTVLFPEEGVAPERFRSVGIPVIILGKHFTASCIPDFQHIIRKLKVDIVYGNNFSGAIRNICIATKIERRPFIWSVREILDQRKTRIRNSVFLRLADRIVVPSSACAASVRPFIRNAQKLRVIHNGVDLERFFVDQSLKKIAREKLRRELRLPAEALILLNLGRITTIKGQDLLLDIAAKVVQQIPQAYFLVVGDVQDKIFGDWLTSAIKERSLGSRVILGNFTKDIVPLLRGIDLLVHTSRSETFGRVLIEAMAMEVPVVAFAVGATPEIIRDKETGYLVRAFDLQEFAEKVDILLKDDIQREAMGVMGRKDILNRFSASLIATEVGQLLEELV